MPILEKGGYVDNVKM